MKIFLMLLIGLIAFFGCFFYLKLDSNIACESHEIFYRQNVKVDAVYTFRLHDNEGVITILGEGSNGEKKVKIDREVHFSYSTDRGNYLLQNRFISKFSEDAMDNTFLTEQLPSLYHKANSKLSLNVIQNHLGAYIISLNKTPIYYCKAT